MRGMKTYACLGMLLLLFSGMAAGAADWPCWRGPARNGIVEEASGWPEAWPPRPAWSRNVGFGCASPVVAGGRLYVMGWSGSGTERPRDNPKGQDTLYCLEASSGQILWQRSYPCLYQGRMRTGDTRAYGGPSSTPAFDPDGGLLYTLSVDGDLVCWDSKQKGKPVWKQNLYDAYGARQRPFVGASTRDYGFAGSPLILGNEVVIEVGAEEGLVMAFDKRSGKRRWVGGGRHWAGHSAGPVLGALNGRPCLAVLALKNLVVLGLEPGHEGNVLGTFPWTTDFACNIASPGFDGNRLLVTSGYNHKASTRVELTPAGLKPLWESRQHAVVSSPVLVDGRFYTLSGRLQCGDLDTGETLWSGGRFGHGSCLLTRPDRKLLVFGEGDLVLVDASPAATAYRELGRVDNLVSGTCYPHVTLSDARIFCKDRDGNLVGLE